MKDAKWYREMAQKLNDFTKESKQQRYSWYEKQMEIVIEQNKEWLNRYFKRTNALFYQHIGRVLRIYAEEGSIKIVGGEGIIDQINFKK
jgi:hypothetical protein